MLSIQTQPKDFQDKHESLPKLREEKTRYNFEEGSNILNCLFPQVNNFTKHRSAILMIGVFTLFRPAIAAG